MSREDFAWGVAKMFRENSDKIANGDGHAVTHHSNERELLLPHGTILKVGSDVTGADGMRTISAEVAT